MIEDKEWIERLTKQTIEHFGALAKRLDEFDPDNGKQFSTIISQALKYWHIPLAGLANEVGFSTGEVEKWAKGINLPQPSVRKRAVFWIKNHFRARAAELAAQLALAAAPLPTLQTPPPKKTRLKPGPKKKWE